MDSGLPAKKRPKKHSISLRVQRTTVEYSYVRVPLTDDMVVFDTDGSGRIDTDRAFTRGLELAQESDVVWFPEYEEVVPHPQQKAPNPEEQALLELPAFDLD